MQDSSTTTDVDVIFTVTGYLYHFPYLSNELRLKSKNCFWTDDLYRGIVWKKAGGNRLLYMGMHNQTMSIM